jgi:hypothetical protein
MPEALSWKLQSSSTQRYVRAYFGFRQEPFCGWRVLEMCRAPAQIRQNFTGLSFPYAGVFSQVFEGGTTGWFIMVLT